MLSIEDKALPGLADLNEERLRVITGAERVALLRLRYRAGKRAILHLEAQSGGTRTEGTLWFFKGDKARRLARRNKATARFAPGVEALFEAFPNDHRMPQIRDFLADHRATVARLTGVPTTRAPVLLRYRPGLSCTFRCELHDGTDAYVKLINDDDVARLLAANRAMGDQLAGTPMTIAPALGVDVSVGAIAYGRAPGNTLDAVLARADTLAPLEQAIAALRRFWQVDLTPERRMDANMLLARARESVAFVAVTAPGSTPATQAVLDRLEASRPDAPLQPVHGDMKLEHLFIDGTRTTLIDTESVSLGLPDYDLAQLYGRLWQAEQEGLLPLALVQAATAGVRAHAGPAFDWCLDVVALRLAKFYAQRPAPGMTQAITAIVKRLH